MYVYIHQVRTIFFFFFFSISRPCTRINQSIHRSGKFPTVLPALNPVFSSSSRARIGSDLTLSRARARARAAGVGRGEGEGLFHAVPPRRRWFPRAPTYLPTMGGDSHESGWMFELGVWVEGLGGLRKGGGPGVLGAMDEIWRYGR